VRAARAEGQLPLAGVKGGEIGVEHLLATTRALFNWAIVEGFTEHSSGTRCAGLRTCCY
jgi:hypothetical protein